MSPHNRPSFDHSPYRRINDRTHEIANQNRILSRSLDRLRKDYYGTPCDRKAELVAMKTTASAMIVTATQLIDEIAIAEMRA